MKKIGLAILEIVQTVAFILVAAFIIRYFLIQPFVVEGNSMEPNFHNKQYLLVDKISYKLRQPARGEVIVFNPPNNSSQNYIKRIIGLPGETIKITGGNIYINDLDLDEKYLTQNGSTMTSSNDFSIALKDNEYFVMGDNRNHSSDSREFGALPKTNIIGRTWLIIWPFQYFGIVHHPKYTLNDFFSSLT
jgi:signal peptidase I